MVRRGLARSRGQAQEFLAAGRVVVDGAPCSRAATPVTEADPIAVTGATSRWVNRGAEKLVHALDVWPIAVAGRIALDVGASTGGFTQVLLDRGAAQVVALDVGHGQLHPTIAADPRVVNREGESIRDLDPTSVPATDLVVADLSFISLTLVMVQIAAVVESHGDSDVVLLVKPQFEVGRGRLGKKGIVADPRLRADALRSVIAAGQAVGLHPGGVETSPIQGTHGNVEYLLWLRPDPSGRMDPESVEVRLRQLTELTS